MALIASAGFYGCHRSGELVRAEPLTSHSAENSLSDPCTSTTALACRTSFPITRLTTSSEERSCFTSLGRHLATGHPCFRYRRHPSSPFLLLRASRGRDLLRFARPLQGGHHGPRPMDVLLVDHLHPRQPGGPISRRPAEANARVGIGRESVEADYLPPPSPSSSCCRTASMEKPDASQSMPNKDSGLRCCKTVGDTSKSSRTCKAASRFADHWISAFFCGDPSSTRPAAGRPSRNTP